MTEDAELRESLADMCRLALLRPIAVVADGAITLRRGVKQKRHLGDGAWRSGAGAVCLPTSNHSHSGARR
jgi:hypothetical protein